MSTNHTPTPWHLTDNGSFFEIVVPWNDRPDYVSHYCPTVCQVMYEGNDGVNGKADAAFIVKAVNAHELLVNALAALLQDIEDHRGGYYNEFDSEEQARAALAAAGEQA